MTSPALRLSLLSFLSAFTIALAGCSLQGFSTPSSGSSDAPMVKGMVHGGQQPVSGASVQFYAANVAASKGASTALLTTPLLTDAQGGFSLPAGFQCPSAAALVYVVATGGNPGLDGTVDNQALAEMALLGTCEMLTDTTFVAVNELTTVASVEALAPFMADYAHVGSDAGNPGGLTGAYASAAAMVDFSTGTLKSAVTGVTIPTGLLNTLADILAACVDTTGGTAGDGTPCGTLLADAGSGGATETVGAVIKIVQAPAANVAALFALVTTQSPFVPALAVAPGDFSTSVTFQVASGVLGSILAIDSSQHVWVYSVLGTVEAPVTGSITVYDTEGSRLFSVTAGSGGLYLPLQLSPDPFGNMWAANANATLSKFDKDGQARSPAQGFPTDFNISTSPFGTINGFSFATNLISIDPNGNVFTIGSGTTSNCYQEFDNAGNNITPDGNFCTGLGNSFNLEMQADGSGDAWLLGDGSIAKVDPEGNLAATGVNTNGCFDLYVDPSPIGVSMGQNAQNAYYGEGITQTLLYDRVKDQLWGLTEDGVGVIRPNGTQASCHAHGAGLPVVPFFSTGTAGCDCGAVGAVYITSGAMDGGGNLWFTTYGFGIILSSSPITFPSSGGLNELRSDGTLLTPFDSARGVYGLASGLQQNMIGATNQQTAIDAYGNIWSITFDQTATVSYLVRVFGLAVPKNYQ